MGMAAAPPHTPMPAATTPAAVSVTSSSYEDDDGAASSWSLSSPRHRLLHDEAQRAGRRHAPVGAPHRRPDVPLRRGRPRRAPATWSPPSGRCAPRRRAPPPTCARPFVAKLTFREMCVVLREQRVAPGAGLLCLDEASGELTTRASIETHGNFIN
ncbi:hypothetical protein EJB05_46732, partial [Eragrostis curvula]